MYRDAAYLHDKRIIIVDRERPVTVTGVGHYVSDSDEVYVTHRPRGREDYQLIYVASGKIHFFFNGKERAVAKGNMVLYRPGEEQKYRLRYEDRAAMFWVHFTGNGIEELLAHYGIKDGSVVSTPDVSGHYEWLFKQMILELRLKRVNFPDLLELNLRHIFLLINRGLCEGATVGSDMLDEVECAVHYFAENYSKDLNVEKYAEERHISVCWFIRVFKRVVKQTPMQYIISLRISAAADLLHNTSYSISYIAATVGYDNALYFSRIFTRVMGVSPTEYRKLGICDLGITE